MRTLLCLLAMIVTALPAHGQTARPGWSAPGVASYGRPDYGPRGPTPIYLAANAYVRFTPAGPHSFRYRNGVRAWYGAVDAFASVLTTGALVAQGPAVAAPASPGPRLYRRGDGMRLWYGQ